MRANIDEITGNITDTDGKLVGHATLINYREDGTLWSSTGRQIYNTSNDRGYLHGIFNNKRTTASRIVWGMHHARPPIGYIRYRNGDLTDNRIDNLVDRYSIKTHLPVRNDPLYALFRLLCDGPDGILRRRLVDDGLVDASGRVTDHGRVLVATRPPKDVCEKAEDLMGRFDFVPMGDKVVDRETGGIQIRRVIYERLSCST